MRRRGLCKTGFARGGIIAGAIALAACAHGSGRYVWVDDLPPNPRARATIAVHVSDTGWTSGCSADTMATKARVRTGGKVAFPILGEMR